MIRGSNATVREGSVTEPGADRGPRAGSPRGVVDATGSLTQPECCIRSLLLAVLYQRYENCRHHRRHRAQKLARAGVDFGVIAAGTPHIVFDQVRERSPLPLISIVEATCDAAARMNLKKIALFGTRFTMQGRFYKDVFARAGITLVMPEPDEQTYIHDKYMNDLVHGIVLPETRERLLAILDKMRERDGVGGLILGGTELSLILRDAEHNGVPILDTTKIHVERIVARLLA